MLDSIRPIIIDNFSAHFADIREYADSANYDGYRNPVDGVVYPGICADVPEFDVLDRLRDIIPFRRALHFMRLSPEGTNPPNWAHSDATMGDWSLMLYLNRAEDCQGGTAFLEHVDGHPDVETWERDTNVPERWRIISQCDMRPNRACIFPAAMWHAAMPRNGFGWDAANGRLVFTCFVS